MKKLHWIYPIVILTISVVFFLTSSKFVQASDRSIDQDVSLTFNNFSTEKLHLTITYDTARAVGDPFPNYEYSGHLLKMGTNDWRMIYGGRCYYDSNKNCQTPINGNYPNRNPSGGDGDHPRYASSTNGLTWIRSLTPLVRPGKFDTPSVSRDNYDYNNHMDPTIIQWNSLYYMYYQVQVTSDENPNCPKDPAQTSSACDRILYATSTNLIDWTKGRPIGEPVIIDSSKPNGKPLNQDHFAWPKAIVFNGEIWLYFGYFRYGYGGQFIGPRVIRSTNPTRFDLAAAQGISSYGGWSQHGVLWPNDPTKRLFVGIVNNWTITNGNGPYKGHKVPTLAFSKNGLDYTTGDANTAVAFPPIMSTMQHEFCNIGTELNGGLQPLTSDPNKIETLYFCSTTNGNNAGGADPYDIFHADLAVGKITFTLPSSSPPATHKECQNLSCTSVPGVGADKCASTTQCLPIPFTHRECANNSCNLVLGLGANECSVNADCAPAPDVTHKECQNQACVSVSGAGPDKCTNNAQCVPTPPLTHRECSNNSCNLVLGPGKNKCAVNANCAPTPGVTHKDCQSEACASVSGAGTDKCTSDTQCITTPPLTHKECSNNSCNLVLGPGENRCATNADCTPPPPVTHKECINNTCTAVSGSGPDNCPNNCLTIPPKSNPCWVYVPIPKNGATTWDSAGKPTFTWAYDTTWSSDVKGVGLYLFSCPAKNDSCLMGTAYGSGPNFTSADTSKFDRQINLSAGATYYWGVTVNSYFPPNNDPKWRCMPEYTLTVPFIIPPPPPRHKTYSSSDLTNLLNDFGKTGNPGFTQSDINGDGQIDIFDYNILVQSFSQ